MGAIRRFRELKDLAVKRKKADKTAPEVKNAISNYLNQTQILLTVFHPIQKLDFKE